MDIPNNLIVPSPNIDKKALETVKESNLINEKKIDIPNNLIASSKNIDKEALETIKQEILILLSAIIIMITLLGKIWLDNSKKAKDI